MPISIFLFFFSMNSILLNYTQHIRLKHFAKSFKTNLAAAEVENDFAFKLSVCHDSMVGNKSSH